MAVFPISLDADSAASRKTTAGGIEANLAVVGLRAFDRIAALA
jgi:hypothetical protein